MGESGGPIRVICVEDDIEMIDLVRLILDRRGFEVVGATNGQDGLAAMAADKADLVLLDLGMPEISGWEVYRRMKADEKLCDVPVIVVTAAASPIDRVLGIEVAGVNDYIIKPFEPSQLLSSIDRVLNLG